MSRRNAVMRCAVVLLTFIATGFGASAASAAPAPAPAAAQYCFTEVAPIAPGSRILDVVSQTCSDTAAPNSVLPESAAAAQQLTLLVTFFGDINYGGAYDTIGGRFGTCDKEGYSFRTTQVANFNTGGISSYKLNGACKRSTMYTEPYFEGSAKSVSGMNVSYVGAIWDNDVMSFKVRS